MFSAISVIATLTRPVTRSHPRTGFGYSSHGGPLAVGVLWRNARHLPHGRSRAGDRHLKFYETRDNLFPTTFRFTNSARRNTSGTSSVLAAMHCSRHGRIGSSVSPWLVAPMS